MAPKKDQVDHRLPPSKVAVYDLPGLGGQEKVDHTLQERFFLQNGSGR